MKVSAQRAGLLALLLIAGIGQHLFAGSPNARLELGVARYRGAALEDLGAAEELGSEAQRLFKAARQYVAAQKDLALAKVVSVSFHSLDTETGTLTVDIFGRDKAFATVNHFGPGGLGFVRAELAFRWTAEGSEITGHKIQLQRDFLDLEPHVTVSLGERLAVVDDDATGFRLAFPLGVGSIDDVHFKGVTTVLTPITELAVLDKNHTTRMRAKPAYYRNKPFIPLNVPLDYPVGNKPVHYRQTAIAFHIWQRPAFARGFLSHGCMRMREADLDAMLEMVEGVKGTIPVKIRIEPVAGAAHPFPLLDSKYSAVQNFGTREHPLARRMKDEAGVMLTKLHLVREAPPAVSSLTGMTLDPAPVGPVPGGLMDHENAIRDSSD